MLRPHPYAPVHPVAPASLYHPRYVANDPPTIIESFCPFTLTLSLEFSDNNKESERQTASQFYRDRTPPECGGSAQSDSVVCAGKVLFG